MIISSLAKRFEFHLPVKIYFGIDSSLELGNICESIGKNFLLVTHKDISNISEKIFSILHTSTNNIDLFYIESGEPTTTFIDNSTKNLKQKSYDCIIGLGGGSAIDTAKCFSISMTNSLPIWEYANLSDRPAQKIEKKVIPVIAIPTTAGTGSEVTPYAVLSNLEKSRKGTIQDPTIFPKIAIVDPKIMMTLPSSLTASTGIDAFAHSLESFLNISKTSPVSEITAIESMRLIFNSLSETYKNPQILEHRQNMALASTLSGIAISHRGTTTPHGIAETIGGLTKLPHAICVSASTLPVLKETLNHATSQLSVLFKNISPSKFSDDPKENAHSFVNLVENLLREVKLDKSIEFHLKEINSDIFDKKVLDYLLKYKFRPLEQHPKYFDKVTLKKIIHEINYGTK